MRRFFTALFGLLLLPFSGAFATAGQSLPELPEDERAALTRKAEPLAANIRKNNPDIKGGPGFCRDTAWVLLHKDASAVSVEYEILNLIFKRRGLSQALVQHDGKYYDVHTYSWTNQAGNPCAIKVWFDITAYFRHAYSADAQE